MSVASEEWAEGEWRKALVVAAGPDDTVWTTVYDLGYGLPFPAGLAGRVLRNAFTDEWHGRDAELVGRTDWLRAELEAAEQAEDPRLAPVWVGSAAGLIDAVEPAGTTVRPGVAEAERLLRDRPAETLR